jgi:hypothetical protein
MHRAASQVGKPSGKGLLGGKRHDSDKEEQRDRQNHAHDG